MQAESKNQRVLIAEDEPEIRSYFEMVLRCQGYSVDTAQDGNEVMAYLRDQHAIEQLDVILLDAVMPFKDGLTTLREIRSMTKDLPVIMVSAASAPKHVLEAMRNGATDFLGKPVNHEDLKRAVANAIGERPPRDLELKIAAPQDGPKQPFFGSNPEMCEIRRLASRIGSSEAPVLIQGETGAGKEVLARYLHALSSRASQPFVKLNCAALPSELVESELFGYEKGAFTGAFQKKPGMLELADGGTILFDEIGDMDFKLQAKLLQVLQDSEFRRVGGSGTIQVNVRVMAATHANLEAGIAKKSFREDLYYRLNVINLRLPPLRERKEDIEAMAELFLEKHTPAGKPALVMNAAFRELLLAHSWPGNVRELENVMRKLLVLGDQNIVAAELRHRALRISSGNAIAMSLDQQDVVAAAAPILEQVTRAKERAESEAIVAALNASHWNRKQAAVLLKVDYKALLYKMKKLGLEGKVVSISTKPAACASPDTGLFAGTGRG
jgi:two-component system, NtrC family, response regulator AtoC